MVVDGVRIDTDGDGNVVDFGVAEKLVGVDFKAIEHFAAQGRMACVALSRASLASRLRIAFDEEEFVFVDVFAFTVGQLTGQDGDAAAFFFSIFNRTYPCLCLTDGEFGDFCRSPRFGSATIPKDRPIRRRQVSARRGWSACLWSDLGIAGRGRGRRGRRRFSEHVVALHFNAAR